MLGGSAAIDSIADGGALVHWRHDVLVPPHFCSSSNISQLVFQSSSVARSHFCFFTASVFRELKAVLKGISFAAAVVGLAVLALMNKEVSFLPSAVGRAAASEARTDADGGFLLRGEDDRPTSWRRVRAYKVSQAITSLFLIAKPFTETLLCS